jgi:hypothetical protein
MGDLKENFIGAEKCNQKNGDTCLDLIYDNNKIIYDQALDLIKFMKENKLGEQLYIRAYEHKNDAVQIQGKYQLKIIKD